MTHDATDQTGLACTLLERELAERKEAIGRELFAHADRVEELPDGFGYRFPAAAPWAAKAVDFIAPEKQCCRSSRSSSSSRRTIVRSGSVCVAPRRSRTSFAPIWTGLRHMQEERLR